MTGPGPAVGGAVDAVAGLVLAPGASATRDHPSLVAIDDMLAGDSIVVERIDLPSSRPGPRVLAVITDAAAALAAHAGLPSRRIAVGGRSFGGRMCSMAVADGLPALGLVLISYPLHPPGRPDVARIGHLPRLQAPCLFVSGTRDPFGAPHELEAATLAVPGPVTHVWIDKGGHGLRGAEVEVAVAVRTWLLALPGLRD